MNCRVCTFIIHVREKRTLANIEGDNKMKRNMFGFIFIIWLLVGPALLFGQLKLEGLGMIIYTGSLLLGGIILLITADRKDHNIY